MPLTRTRCASRGPRNESTSYSHHRLVHQGARRRRRARRRGNRGPVRGHRRGPGLPRPAVSRPRPAAGRNDGQQGRGNAPRWACGAGGRTREFSARSLSAGLGLRRRSGPAWHGRWIIAGPQPEHVEQPCEIGAIRGALGGRTPRGVPVHAPHRGKEGRYLRGGEGVFHGVMPPQTASPCRMDCANRQLDDSLTTPMFWGWRRGDPGLRRGSAPVLVGRGVVWHGSRSPRPGLAA